MNSKQRFRARLILACIILIAGSLVLALYSIQIIDGKSYVAKADRQYIKSANSVFDRGSIFFSTKDGTYPAAATLTSEYLIYMNPKLIKDPVGTYQALSQYIKLDQEQFMRKAALVNDPYEELARKVGESIVQSISALSLRGIGILKESKRSYPGNQLAAHALGIIGENNGLVEGRYGLERTYEDVLARTGVGGSANIFAQLFSSIGGSVSGGKSGGRGDIVTTIEPTAQGYLENVLAKTSTEWKPDEIGGIIMDPQTGNIVAMAALPSFDPNDTSKVKDPAVFSNSLVENAYEMGSIMKPLTIAAGFDSQAITSSFTYDDTGTITLSGKKISNFDGKARGVIPVQEILSQSLNVGVATVALKVGKDDFSKYFLSFGLGSKTGIDQPNETSGLASNLKTGRDIEIATMAYGQGIAVSPMAMTRALSILANNGKLVTPHIVQEIDYLDGTKKKINPDLGTSVLEKQTVEDVTGMLVKVVDTALRKGALKMEHYSIAAKTGTAQIPDPVTKGYYPDRYLHSFFGYFPAYNPKFIIFLYQKYPKGARYASETLVNPFNDLTKFLIDYYNVPPDR
ncbi:MAG: penicillin-binding protein 2 [Patescibacteria group bacterium]